MAQNVFRRVVVRRGGDQNHPFAAADFRQFLVGNIGLGTEAVGFVNNDVGIFLCSPIQNIIKFANRFKISRPHAKINKSISPRTWVIFIQQHRWGNHQRSAVQLSRQQGSDIGFSQPHHIGNEHTSVLFENFLGVPNGLFLIFEF